MSALTRIKLFDCAVFGTKKLSEENITPLLPPPTVAYLFSFLGTVIFMSLKSRHCQCSLNMQIVFSYSKIFDVTVAQNRIKCVIKISTKTLEIAINNWLQILKKTNMKTYWCTRNTCIWFRRVSMKSVHSKLTYKTKVDNTVNCVKPANCPLRHHSIFSCHVRKTRIFFHRLTLQFLKLISCERIIWFLSIAEKR